MGCRFLIINAIPVMRQFSTWFVFHGQSVFRRNHPLIAVVEVRLILERVIVRVVVATMRVLAHLYVFDLS